MNRAFVGVGMVLLAGCAGGEQRAVATARQAAPPRIALAEAGDSVLYLEQTTALTFIDRGGDTLVVSSRHDAVIHVVRTAPDTLEGFYEHLIVSFEAGTQTRSIDTRPLIGVRFVLHDDDGRIETVSSPELPAEIRQMSDLRRQFEDFFLRLPDGPLDIGAEWVDTVTLNATDGESSTGRVAVTRFRVSGDTIVDGIAARTVDYETVVESSMRSAPTAQGTLTSMLTGGEDGSFVYAPDRAVMLRRYRVGVLEGEVVVAGNLETLRFPQTYSYESRIALLPPADPAGARRRAPEPPAETPPRP